MPIYRLFSSRVLPVPHLIMTSNFISRFTSSQNNSASIYETIREHEQDSGDSDLEERAGLVSNLPPYADGFQDLEPDRLPANQSQPRPGGGSQPRKGKGKGSSRPRWAHKNHKLLDVEEADDDVPASLLIEDGAGGRTSISLPPPPSHIPDELPQLFPDTASSAQSPDRHRRRRSASDQYTQASPTARNIWGSFANQDPREKAMFRWVNVLNLDNFLLDVYNYYICHGFWSTVLMRVFNIVTIGFIVGFSLFLTQCIDYRKLKGSNKMSEIRIPNCASKMGFIPNALLWITTFIWLWKSVSYVLDIPRLRHMHDFYLHLLNIPEDEIQSISWQEVVSRLMALRDSNPNTAAAAGRRQSAWIRTQSKQRMDAHDIASRLMRRQNYMIAMINKDILDLTLPIPFLRNRRLFTRTLEWSIDLCIMDFVFNEKGQIKSLFLKDTHRTALSTALRNRFFMTGVASLIFSPFLAAFFVIKHIFLNFNEYQKNPAKIGSREYNPYAEWKFREFNELYHLFQRRINMSYPFASRYINQFPKDKTVQAAQLVTLVSGAVVSVLGLATVLDQENFLNFEITPGRTTIFYLGLFGGIWAVARGLLPDDNMVYDTANSLQEVIDFTHYQPEHWKGRLHSTDVKQEFSQLYQMKLVIFAEEVLSMIFTPFVLCFSLPKCSDRIIDFFREFTIHVDGIGYVCSFAEFGFNNQGAQPPPNVPTKDTREQYFSSKDNKLENSYWGFINDYARNPKTDIRYNYQSSKRRFNMPPPAPGLLSPSFAPTFEREHTFGSAANRQSILSPPHRASSGTPKFASQQPQLGSPLQSLLLDPHHQPSATGFGTSPQPGRNARGGQASVVARRRRPRPSNVTEEDPSDRVDRTTNQPRGPAQNLSGMTEQTRKGRSNGAEAGLSSESTGVPAMGGPETQSAEGELGSWKYENESEDDDPSDASDEEEDNLKTVTGGGPLNLIRQFQKAHHQGEARNTSGLPGI